MDDVLAATQADLFWLPSAVKRLDRPDVLAVADGGKAELHNQVVRTSTRDADIPALIEEVSAFHRGPVSQWLVVPPGNGAALEEHLPRFGYAPRFEGDAFTLPSNTILPEGTVTVVRVADERTLLDNIDVCHRAFGRPSAVPLDAARQLQMCTEAGSRTARFVAYLGEEPVGSANINRYDALCFGFLWAGAVLPAHRGRGIYRALLGARCRWARSQGLSTVGLYAKRTTSGPVVTALGFERHGTMAYWQQR